MDEATEARDEYIKFLLLLVFFGALMAGAALLRPLILGERRPPPPTETPFIMALAASTVTPVASSSPEPTPSPPPSPTPTATGVPAATVGPSIYVVQAGDTLTRISQAHGVSVDDLVNANGLPDRDRILIGQELIIPALSPGATPAPSSYIVKRGDTLWGIARTAGVELDLLVEINEISDPDRITAGQVLKIPR